MIAALEGLATLAGDALSAAGAALRTRREGFADYEAGDYLITAPIPRGELSSALDELPDSELLNIAATIIAGWKLILLNTTGDLTGVNVLVDALRDRASEFEAVEGEADQPSAHLTE